jgi:hypothetical protein
MSVILVEGKRKKKTLLGNQIEAESFCPQAKRKDVPKRGSGDTIPLILILGNIRSSALRHIFLFSSGKSYPVRTEHKATAGLGISE